MSNIVEFVQSELSESYPRFPVHLLLMKVIHGIPLDDVEEFTITDWGRENPRQFTEKTYLEYLYDSGKASVRSVGSREFSQVVLCLGRRGGDQCLVSALAAYAVSQVTSGEREIQKGLRAVGVTLVSPNRKEWLQETTTSFLNESPTLRLRAKSGPRGGIWFGPGESQGVDACVAFRKGSKVSHARPQQLVVLDDFAFYPLAREMYCALAPLTTPTNGKLVMVSQPHGRQGFFYDTFMRGMNGEGGILSIQIPSWELNPTLPAGFFQKFHEGDPKTFREEHGAEWSDDTRIGE